MTDPDDRIAALFREAASDDAPPPAFDHDRVVATSRRITARRRSAVLGGAMALLVVAGVGVAVALPRAVDGPASAAAPALAPDSAAESAPGPLSAPGADQSARDAAEPAPGSGAAAAAPFTGTPLGPGTTACAQRQDPQLRALLEQVLPEVVGAVEAAVTMDCRPGGERGVSLEVDDAGTAGLLTVQYLPPGTAADAVGGVTAPTASGGTVVISAGPGGPGGAVPFEDRLDATAAYLAPRL